METQTGVGEISMITVGDFSVVTTRVVQALKESRQSGRRLGRRRCHDESWVSSKHNQIYLALEGY